MQRRVLALPLSAQNKTHSRTKIGFTAIPRIRAARWRIRGTRQVFMRATDAILQ